jgi:hypothetical protein
MRHPKVDSPPVGVPKSAVPHYTAGGWEECEPPQPPMRPSKQNTSTRTERRRTPRSSKED